MKRSVLRRGLVAAALAFVAFNALAYRHAWAMTHFTASGHRTPRAEALSLRQKLRVLASGATLPRRTNDRTPADLGLGFEPQTFTTRDGERLEGWFVPRAEARGTVLLFHGYADRKASLLDAAQAFHELGYACLLVDFRGSGGSSGETTSIGYHEAEDVRAALVHAGSAGAPRPLILFGVSMGAAAVLRACSELGADAAAIILQYPFSKMTVTVARRFQAMGLPAFPAAEVLVLWGGVQLHFNGFRHNPVDYARGVRAPTLLFQGDRDDRVSVMEAQEILAALAGPKRLRIFEGAGHESLVKRQPEIWNTEVASFLADPLAAKAR